jgi:diguanylate cyclase
MIDSTWDDGHTRRVKAMLLSASILTIVLGVSWCIGYLLEGRPILAMIYMTMASSGLGLAWLIMRDQLRLAAMIEAHLLPIFTGVFCLFDTVPVGLPHAMQLHFLPLAIASHFIFRREHVYFKFVLPALSLVAFLIFANMSPAIPDSATVIPRWDAWIGVWVHTITALAGLVVALLIMNSDLTVRHMMEGEIRKAIAKGEFRLHYQPQLNEAGQVIGAEALIRWRHGKMGNIPPGKFIPLAEETGLIVPIGNWVLRAACMQLALWQARPETEHLTLAVNVSASQFHQPDFVQVVTEIVRLSGINPSRLKLELTESMFVDNIDATVAKMNALRATGIAWSLDDFGTGYSSLSVLHRFPLAQVKIDQSFVRDMLSNKSNMVIIEAIIDLARNLGLQVLAEGIETTDQHLRLREAGCRAYQGYLFSPPIDIDSFEKFITPAPQSRIIPALL